MNNYFIFFDKETGKAQHLAYNINPDLLEHMVQPGQVVVQVEDSAGWESLTLQDTLNRSTD